MLEERREALERDLLLRAKSVQESEERVKRIQDELELRVFEYNEIQKSNVEQRLKIECMTTKEEGLLADIRLLQEQLKESNEFKDMFRVDNEKLRFEYSVLLDKHNSVNQKLSGFQAVFIIQEEKIKGL